MFCEGQLLPISENETLFNLIGTTYGGDGQSTFALPDLRGRLPIHRATASRSPKPEESEEITLTASQIPAHSHPMLASLDIRARSSPTNSVTGQAAGKLYRGGVPAVTLDPGRAWRRPAARQPHTNMQPYLCVNFIISLFGIFPSPT